MTVSWDFVFLLTNDKFTIYRIYLFLIGGTWGIPSQLGLRPILFLDSNPESVLFVGMFGLLLYANIRLMI